MRVFTYAFLAFILISSKSIAQKEIDFSIGVTLLQDLNAGIHYQFNQSVINFQYGKPKDNHYKINAYSLSYNYHLFGKSSHSSRKPYFVKGGFTYRVERRSRYFEKTGWYLLYFGREFNLSKRFGSSVALGLIGNIFEQLEINSIPRESIYNYDRFFPGGEVRIFYRLPIKDE